MSASLQFIKPSPQSFLRTSLLLAAVVGAAAIWQFQEQITAQGLIVTSINFRAALYAGYVFVGLLALSFILSWTPFSKQLIAWLAVIQEYIGRVGIASIGLFLLLLAAFPLVVLGFYGRFLLNPFPRLFLFLIFCAIGASLLAAFRRNDWLSNLPISALAIASVYLAATFFDQVTNFPFSLEWSEISRYYQASFFFSEQVYGTRLPLPVTHPSRYLLQSIPFLIPGSSLLIHRLWQALLWVVLPLVTAWLLAKRFRLDAWLQGSLILWIFLFLLQGPVYYHLLPCVFLVLAGYNKDRPWQTFLFVAFASIWAGISRINWAPLPGGLATLLYLLESGSAKKFFSWKYLWQLIGYAFGGTLIALASYAVYIAVSGVSDPSQFGSSFTSELLWDRLLPNDTFLLGILPGILLVSVPIFILAWMRWRQQDTRLGFWRTLSIGVLLLTFFVGGLVVSVKIGGGTNLHNLDAYLVLLLVLGLAFGFGAYAAEKNKKLQPLKIPSSLLALLLLLPVLFAIFNGDPLVLPSGKVTDEMLVQIQNAINEETAQGGEVLFISQRHLLTFHQIENVQLVPEYEKLFLMEMAISHNTTYLQKFARDIDEQRFALIITDPLFRQINDVSEDTLAAENNAWVRAVSRPVLCAYEPLLTFSNPSIQLLVPRYGDKCNQ